MSIVLMPHQEQCVNFHLLHQYSLNGSGMGVGKTAIALEFMRRTGKMGLVVGPAFLEGTWLAEGEKFNFTDFKYIPYSQIHNYTEKDLNKYGVWVADESHYLKNPKAKRTQCYYNLLKKVKPKYWAGLSGTPIKNKVFDLWVPLAICSQCPDNSNGLRLTGEHTKYYSFARHFCHSEMLRVRNARIEKFGSVKEDKVPELKALLKDKYIRFSLDDVAESLPEMVEKDVFLNLKPVKGLEETFNNYMAGSKVDPTSKAASALLKVQSTVEYVEDLLEYGESVLIFSDHVAAAETIAEKLNGIAITGKTDSSRRHILVDQFQEGRLKVISATIGSLSVGVTLTKARHVVFNDLSWTHSDNQQAKARIHRIGQKRACVAHYILASETDFYIKKTLEQKAKTVLKVLGHE